MCSTDHQSPVIDFILNKYIRLFNDARLKLSKIWVVLLMKRSGSWQRTVDVLVYTCVCVFGFAVCAQITAISYIADSVCIVMELLQLARIINIKQSIKWWHLQPYNIDTLSVAAKTICFQSVSFSSLLVTTGKSYSTNQASLGEPNSTRMKYISEQQTAKAASLYRNVRTKFNGIFNVTLQLVSC